MVKRPRGTETFISWLDLYCELEDVDQDKVNPEDVLRRLRGKAYYVKAFLRESGYGWVNHRADRSLLRATLSGEDSRKNCEPYYRRRAQRAIENHVDVVDKTVGDPRMIAKTKENERELAMLNDILPKHRALLVAFGVSAETSNSTQQKVKKAA